MSRDLAERRDDLERAAMGRAWAEQAIAAGPASPSYQWLRDTAYRLLAESTPAAPDETLGTRMGLFETGGGQAEVERVTGRPIPAAPDEEGLRAAARNLSHFLEDVLVFYSDPNDTMSWIRFEDREKLDDLGDDLARALASQDKGDDDDAAAEAEFLKPIR